MKLEERLAKLTEKLEKMTSVYPEVYDAKIVQHLEERSRAARRYLAEIQEISSLLGMGHEVEWISRAKFDRSVRAAEYASLDYDGEFCKIAIVSNFTDEPKWLITCKSPEYL